MSNIVETKEIPAHFRMIIRLPQIGGDKGTYIEGGVIEMAETQEKLSNMSVASDTGIVVKMGPACFNVGRFQSPDKDKANDEGLCQVGDEIRFKSYSGYGFHSEDKNGNKTNYVTINDEDFINIIERGVE